MITENVFLKEGKLYSKKNFAFLEEEKYYSEEALVLESKIKQLKARVVELDFCTDDIHLFRDITDQLYLSGNKLRTTKEYLRAYKLFKEMEETNENKSETE